MTKVTLSNTEMNLVLNQSVFLTKNKVIQKVYELFQQVHEGYKYEINSFIHFPPELKSTNGKISKGENYLQQPWVMLDTPNFFKGNNVFAVRTFFWWGNFISINFLVMGIWLEEVKGRLLNQMDNYNDWFICINNDAWQHHFENNNMKKLDECRREELEHLTFIKLSKKIPLQEWDNIEIFLQESFVALKPLMETTSFPVDEKVL
ncbi:MAG: hypothetical protein KGZ59_09740 [Chitinophagaceae bacterium]|nr:hypothetical protein [Chitinophagaceae bacterium]